MGPSGPHPRYHKKRRGTRVVHPPGGPKWLESECARPPNRKRSLSEARQSADELWPDSPEPQSELAQQLIKDPYNFDFLTLGPKLLERDLERELIEHVRNLILELGKGLASSGSRGQDYYLDLLFYHVRLRCYVVTDLKIEDFKPEFAGKMNFYLSVVDEQLRHADDRPSIGIILCNGRNEVIVEYALRDTNKPIGVAHYQLTPGRALPEALREDLPTVAELSREFPLLSVVKVRIEIEQALNDLAQEHGLAPGPHGVGLILRELDRKGLLPDSATDLSRVR